MRKNRLTFAALSLCLLALVACGRKGNPVPKGLPVPGTISDLRGDARDAVLFLSFTVPTKNMNGTEVKDLAGFRIMKSCGPCGGAFEQWKDIRLAEKQGYTIRNGRFYTYDDDLVPGAVYGYRVYPYNGKGVQFEGSNVFSIKWQEPPPPPKGVSAKEEDTKIVLSWEWSDDLTYNVYRWDDGAYPLFALNPSPIAGDNYTDTGLLNGKTYKYEVRSVRTEGTLQFEGRGAAITATPKDLTPPASPTGITLEKKDGGVLISWQPNHEPDLAGYNVYRLALGKAQKANETLVGQTRFFDAKPGPDVRYASYYVTAVDKSGNESGPSREHVIVLEK